MLFILLQVQLQLELQEQRDPPHGEGALPEVRLQRQQRGTSPHDPGTQFSGVSNVMAVT